MKERQRLGFSDIDAWGLTHPGKLRSENQYFFFRSALVHGVSVEQSSAFTERPGIPMDRLASPARWVDSKPTLL